MAGSPFKILSTQTRTYIDEGGSVVNGYRVTYRILEFQEVHYIDVPSLNKATVAAAIQNVINDRKDLSTL
jgi:hypothetical protein